MCNRFEESHLKLGQWQVPLFSLLLETPLSLVLQDSLPDDYTWLSGHILSWWSFYQSIRWLQRVHNNLNFTVFGLSAIFPLWSNILHACWTALLLVFQTGWWRLTKATGQDSVLLMHNYCEPTWIICQIHLRKGWPNRQVWLDLPNHCSVENLVQEVLWSLYLWVIKPSSRVQD